MTVCSEKPGASDEMQPLSNPQIFNHLVDSQKLLQARASIPYHEGNFLISIFYSFCQLNEEWPR